MGEKTASELRDLKRNLRYIAMEAEHAADRLDEDPGELHYVAAMSINDLQARLTLCQQKLGKAFAFEEAGL